VSRGREGRGKQVLRRASRGIRMTAMESRGVSPAAMELRGVSPAAMELRGIAMTAVVIAALACGKSEPPPPAANTQPAASTPAPAPAPAPVAAAPGDPACPQTGLWAECSVLYRLERAGLAPHVDSTAKAEDKTLTGRVLMLKIGRSAQLELHIFADSAARAAAGKTLDRTSYVGPTAPQTVKREKTLIESVNVIGLLTSINAHQRERISDALTAGPPQPQQAQTLKPVTSK